MKYYSYAETFSEVPDEISLYITISGCKIRCPDCNSKWLWEDRGVIITPNILLRLIEDHKGITCVCIGGGDNFIELNTLFKVIKSKGLKSCWYTGYDKIPKEINLALLDYIKIGHFNGKPLNNSETNQRMYKVNTIIKDGKIHNLKMEDITNVFYNKIIQ